MRILFISPSFYPATYYGGPIFSIYNSARCLAKNGIRVSVSTTNCNGKQKLDVTANQIIKLQKNLFVKYYSDGTKSGFSIRMFLLLWKDIKGKECIYLVSVFSPSTPLVIFLNLFFRKPLILSPRGQLGKWCLQQGNILKKTWLKIFIKPIANNITWEATSVPEKEMIRKVFPEAKVEVIPSIINVEEFAALRRDEPKAQSLAQDYSIYEKLTGRSFKDKKIIISMGRLHKVKGFDILIEAVKLVQDKSQDIVFLIAGEDFGERIKLEKLIDELYLKEKVFLVGMIDGQDKLDFLRNADLFALASHHENFGIVYAEALASGTPIVASKNTPWEDVEKYNCGKWVNNIPEKFAAAIEEILHANDTQMRINGRKYIEDNFGCNSIFKKYQFLFNTILRENN